MENKPEPKLLDQVRECVRLRHYSIRTEEAYVHWTKRYILFHKKRHPAEMGQTEVREFLSYLAVQRTVSASTQNQALAALLFLYNAVLRRPLEEMGEIERLDRPAKRHRAGATTSTRKPCNAPYTTPFVRQASASTRRAIPFGIRLRRISYRVVRERTVAAHRRYARYQR